MLTPAQRRRLRRATDGPNRVAFAIELAEVTQVQVAEAIGLTQPTVSRVCTGSYERLPGETMRAFAQYFGCAIEDLFPAREAMSA